MLTAPGQATSPFLKWVGGKRQLLPSLRQRYPQRFSRYFEPFLGGGAVFFDLDSQGCLIDRPAMLSDLSGDLIGCYLMVRDDVEDVIQALTDLSAGHRDGAQNHYSLVRDQFNASRERLRNRSGAGYTPELAAQFIYLNRTGFNGLFRLNARGAFNVPKGSYKNPTICDDDGLRRVADVLTRSTVRIVEADFELILESAEAGDFVYCDPPYAPVSETSDFTAYTPGGFSTADQMRLQQRVIELARRGCWVVVSNSAAPLIEQLYANSAEAREAGLQVYPVSARRNVNATAAGRGAVSEFVITNVRSAP